ncbi:MAG: hypothetical protein L3J11_09555 [Draconibacterium sp.]|nr:hypothetical protein [Draconibacterium sp.]
MGQKKKNFLTDHTSLFSESSASLFSENTTSLIADFTTLLFSGYKSTRGHVFITMLAYMIIKYITDTLSELKYTRKYIFESLDKINYLQYTYGNEKINIVPEELLPSQEKILDALKIKLK